MTRLALALIGCFLLFGALVGVLKVTSHGRTDFLIVQLLVLVIFFLLGLLLWDVSWRLLKRFSRPK